MQENFDRKLDNVIKDSERLDAEFIETSLLEKHEKDIDELNIIQNKIKKGEELSDKQLDFLELQPETKVLYKEMQHINNKLTPEGDQERIIAVIEAENAKKRTLLQEYKNMENYLETRKMYQERISPAIEELKLLGVDETLIKLILMDIKSMHMSKAWDEIEPELNKVDLRGDTKLLHRWDIRHEVYHASNLSFKQIQKLLEESNTDVLNLILERLRKIIKVVIEHKS